VTLIRDQRLAARRALGDKGDADRVGVVAGLDSSVTARTPASVATAVSHGGQQPAVAVRAWITIAY
jgi:hypothetical protein